MAYFFNDSSEYALLFHFDFTGISVIEKEICPMLKLYFLLSNKKKQLDKK